MQRSVTSPYIASGVGLYLAAIIAMGLLVLTISLLSGFHYFPVPFDLAWQFTPLGLVQGITPESLAIGSHGYFAGKLGLTLDYLAFFAKTCVLEAPLYYLCFRGERAVKTGAVLLAGNLLTHPLVFFVIPTLFARYLTSALVSEAYAAIGEMLFAFWILSKTQPTAVAARRSGWIVLANLFSWQFGIFLL